MRIAIYNTRHGPSFFRLQPLGLIGYIVVPEGSWVDDEGQLNVPDEPRSFAPADLATQTDAYFQGFGFITPEAMAA
jgi:hypothetical protein